MAVNLPSGLSRVTWLYTNTVGHACRTSLYYSTDTAPINAAKLDAYSAELGPLITNVLGTSSNYNGCEAVNGDGTSTPTVVLSNAGAGAGGDGSAKSPPQVQALIRKFTTHAGRHARGRLYLPDVPESEVLDDGFIAAGTYKTHLQDLATALTTTLPASLEGDPPPVLYDAKTGTVGNVIVACVIEDKVATQRRRFRRT